MEEQVFRRYPVGKQDFKQIREGGFVYVDKTRYVWELANRFGDSIFLRIKRQRTISDNNGQQISYRINPLTIESK